MGVGAFYFHWCDEGTAFGSGVLVEDEKITAFDLAQTEGDFATLRITVRNPRIGPLNASRKRWCWFSLDIGTAGSPNVVPLFYGQLMAMPTDIAANSVEFTFRAMPSDIYTRKAAVADSLRVLPFYDELFLDLSSREDPDKVLEGYASLWHCNRTTHEVTVSSITEGEDGTEIFTADEVPNDSVKSDFSQTPINLVGVDATVRWQQKSSGIVDMGSQTFVSYTGGSMVSGWPATGTNLGSGYTALSSLAHDAMGEPQQFSMSYNWQNIEKTHQNGDAISYSEQRSGATTGGPSVSGTTSVEIRNGLLDPYAVDIHGDPAPINISPYYKEETMSVFASSVRAGMILRYDANRARSERVLFTVAADLQPMIGNTVDPHAGEEAITIGDHDAGTPIIRLRSWYNVRNSWVELGTIIFAEFTGFPGMKIAQIVILDGTTGTNVPPFSPILGDITDDGTARWSSMGPVDPGTTAGEWPKQSDIVAGLIILPNVPLVIRYRDLVMPGAIAWPVAGVSVSEGQIVQGNNGSYQICTIAGTTEVRAEKVFYQGSPDYAEYIANLRTIPVSEPNWPTTWGVHTIDNTVTWTCLGMSVPNGSSYHICTTAGTTGLIMPPFATAVGGTTADGTAIWTNIAASQIPAGGVTGDVRASSYFPTDRGNLSLEYLICLARSKLLYGARAVKITFECAIERAVALSCRKNALLQTPQLPGGQAFGKIIDYTLHGDGDGKRSGTVTIGCTIGKGNAVTVSAGDPTYVAAGYMTTGYQQMENKTVALPDVGDVGYSPPLDRTIDDGLVFPLTRAQIVEAEFLTGSLQDQMKEAQEVIASNRHYPVSGRIISFEDADQRARELAAKASSSSLKTQIIYELHLKRLTDVTFASLYSIRTQPLVAPKHIDLEAAAT